VPGAFKAEVLRALGHHRALSAMLDEQDVDSADRYMAHVLETDGRRIYEAVLAVVSAARRIPPKDAMRP
jgi:hypothetical protein